MHINDITGSIIQSAIEIHRRLGPGLLESVYRKILAHHAGRQRPAGVMAWPRGW